MIATEFQLTGRGTTRSFSPHGTQSRSHESLCRTPASVENKSRSGLTGGDAAKLDRYLKVARPCQTLPFLCSPKCHRSQ